MVVKCRRLTANGDGLCGRICCEVTYDTIGEFNVDWKAEYSALSSTRSQKKKLKQPTPVPL